MMTCKECAQLFQVCLESVLAGRILCDYLSEYALWSEDPWRKLNANMLLDFIRGLFETHM